MFIKLKLDHLLHKLQKKKKNKWQTSSFDYFPQKLKKQTTFLTNASRG